MENEDDALFPEVEGEDETYKPKIVATAKKVQPSEGDTYSLTVPSIFPSKHEEEYLASNILDNLENSGLTPTEVYIAFKQLCSISEKGMEQVKERAIDFAREFGVKFTRGVKVSMRGSFGGYAYDDEIEVERMKLVNEINELKNRLDVLEKSAKQSGKAKKLPGKPGIAITFREM
jgi:hypothetical protein